MGRLVIVFIVCFIPLILFYSDPRVLGVRWSSPPKLPFTSIEDLQLASSWRLIKHSAFKLACAPSGKLHLVVQARVPGPREYVRVGRIDIGVFVDDDLDELDVTANLVAVGQVDTVVTAALTGQQLQRLSDLFGDAEPRKVAIALGSESMVFMSGDADGTEVRRLASGCERRR